MAFYQGGMRGGVTQRQTWFPWNATGGQQRPVTMAAQRKNKNVNVLLSVLVSALTSSSTHPPMPSAMIRTLPLAATA